MKTAQTFRVLDADTHQPMCFITVAADGSVVDATPKLMDLAKNITQPAVGQTLVMADSETPCSSVKL